MAFTAPTVDIVVSGDQLLTFTANEDVIRGQVVKLAGADNEVQPSDTDGEQVLGVATQTKSAGEQVTVAMPGCEVKFTSGEALSRNDALASHGASGEEGQVATSATGDFVIGVTYEATGGAGNLVRGMIDPGYGAQVN